MARLLSPRKINLSPILFQFFSESIIAGVLGFLGNLLDPFDAISGELSGDDMLTDQYLDGSGGGGSTGSSGGMGGRK